MRNYHDNRGLDTAFLARSLGQPDLLPNYAVLARRRPAPKAGAATPARLARLGGAASGAGRRLERQRPRRGRRQLQRLPRQGRGVRPAPGVRPCERCHAFETETFGAGKHGVRSHLGLAPLTPAEARLPMQKAVAHQPHAMSCGACHDVHSVNARRPRRPACAATPTATAWPSPARLTTGPPGRRTRREPAPSPAPPATCRASRSRKRAAPASPCSTTTASPCARWTAWRSWSATVAVAGAALAAVLDREGGRRNYPSRPAGRARSFSMVKAARTSGREGGAPSAVTSLRARPPGCWPSLRSRPSAAGGEARLPPGSRRRERWTSSIR